MSPSKLPDMTNHPFSITVDIGAGSERVGDRAAPTQTLSPDSSLCLHARQDALCQTGCPLCNHSNLANHCGIFSDPENVIRLAS